MSLEDDDEYWGEADDDWEPVDAEARSTYGSCRLTYADFRTGLDYDAVHALMWTPSTDVDDWRYRGRSGVLGYWHQLKQMMWGDHEDQCAEIRRRIEDRGNLTPF